MDITKKRNFIILMLLIILIAAVCVLTFAKFLPHATLWLIVAEDEAGAMGNDSIIIETNLSEFPILRELIEEMPHGRHISVPITDDPLVMRQYPKTISVELGWEIIDKFGRTGNQYFVYKEKYYQIRWSEA